MIDWTKYKLGDICDNISYGYTESASKTKVGPKFLRITDIQNDNINWNDVPYCPISESDNKKYKLEIGDVVIARTGNSTGATAVIKQNVEAVFASYLIRFRLNKNIANPFYVDFVLRSKLWNNFIESIKGGSAQPGANAKQLSEFELSLPELHTQNQIASILSSLDNKIELNRSMNHTLEQMPSTIFKKYFVDNIDPDNLPVGWKMGTVQDLFVLQRGFDLPSQNRSDGIYQVVAASGINGYHDTAAIKGPGVTTGRSGVIGNVFYIKSDFWPLNTSLFIKEFRVSTPLHAFYLLKSLNLKEMNAGSAVPTLNRNHVHNIPIEIPPKQLVIEFESLVLPFFKLIDSKTNENHELLKIRNTLLPKLMSGEIDVSSITQNQPLHEAILS